MEEKYIWPLIGVILGWGLTALSASFKDRLETRRRIGNLLAKLIRVERQLLLVMLATEKMKDFAESWSEYEEIRQGVIKRHFLQPDSVGQDLKKSIDDVAPLYPVLAIDLENTFELLMKTKMSSLSASSNNEEAYIRMLSVYEVGLDFCKRDLSAMIYRIALKHGVETYLKLKYVNHRRNRNQKSSLAFSEKFSSEIMQELRKTHNKSSKKDAESRASS